MFALDLPRAGMLLGVGLAHAAVALAFAQRHMPERAIAPVVFAETLFFPEHEPVDERPTPVVNLEPLAMRLDPSTPRIEIESAAIADAPPSANAPTAVVSSAPVVGAMTAVAVEEVQYVQAPKPRYPAISRRLKEQGVVVLKVLVNERGEAQRIEVADSSGFERLDRAAVEAVAGATFRPLLENGVPRAMLVLIPIEFGLHRAKS